MKKNFLVSAALSILMLWLFTTTSNAQYVQDKSYLGPSIGFSFLGSTPDFGASYEYGINLQNFGMVGIGGLFRYWGYSGVDWSYTNIVIGAQGNYHFQLSNNKLDPYVGVVLAYDAGTVSYKGSLKNYVSPSYGGLWLAVQGGARYWISPTIAINGRIGLGTLGYSGLDFGVDFKF